MAAEEGLPTMTADDLVIQGVQGMSTVKSLL